MSLIRNIIGNKSTNSYSLSKTVKDIFQLFLDCEKSDAAKQGLAKVLEFFDADRIYIGYFNESDSSISFIHESTAEGVANATGLLNQQFNHKKKYSEEEYPLWIGNIKNGIDTVISDIDRMPMISFTEIPLLIENNVKSSITTSIHQEGVVCGFLGIDFVNRKHKWDEEDIENVHFFANIFSVVIENEYMQKEIEETTLEVFKSKTIFQLVFDTLPVGIELYDANGILRKINPYGLHLLGTKEEDVLGVNLFENPNISPSSFDKLRKGEPTVFENDYFFDKVNETGYYKSDNSRKVLRLIGKCTPLKDMNGHIFGYLELVHNDATYYKTKEELNTNLTKLRMALEAQNAFFWEYDIKNEQIIIDANLLNNQEGNPLPRIRKEVLGNTFIHFEQIHPEDVESFRKHTDQLFRGEISSFEETYREEIAGKMYWLYTCFQTYKLDEEGKPERIICLTTDITEQREKDIEIIKNKEFSRVRKSFVSNISHEIRTPLNAILGFTKIITESKDSGEQARAYGKIVQQNNEILLHMIDSILDFTQIESGPIIYEKEAVDLKEICHAAINLTSFNKKEHLDFHFDSSQPSLFVYVDKKHIKQAIYHLLDNANKFTEKGSISLSYSQQDEGFARIEVTDTGIGLTPEEINHIYNQFYKIDDYQRGIGLGLSITKRFIEDQGGETGVESEKGKGSTFWFTLPVAKPTE
ncbi:PAS domain-containing protein [Parabacteroides sp. OttesenSCG-928-B22]|nr:PAS domain-containing protein [Parabacteroides sp. OttesenSCG-928-B22]